MGGFGAIAGQLKHKYVYKIWRLQSVLQIFKDEKSKSIRQVVKLTRNFPLSVPPEHISFNPLRLPPCPSQHPGACSTLGEI